MRKNALVVMVPNPHVLLKTRFVMKIVFFVLLLTSFQVMANPLAITVTGRVTGEGGQPLAGASVQEKVC